MDPIKEMLKLFPDRELKYVKKVEPRRRKIKSRRREYIPVRVRKIIRQNTRGLCMLCDRYTRRFDVGKRKYLCSHHGG